MLVESRFPVLRAVVVVLLAGLMGLLAGTPAHAHADLKSSDPRDGATLAQAPAALTFVFGENILEEGNAVTLTIVESDTRIPLGAPQVDGDTVSVAWPERSPAGELRAAYRVVSADGHPIEGTVTFRVRQAVGEAAAASIRAAAEPSAVAETAAGSEPTASPGQQSTGPETVTPDPATDAGEGDARLALLFFLALAAAVVAGGYAGLWFMRKSR